MRCASGHWQKRVKSVWSGSMLPTVEPRARTSRVQSFREARPGLVWCQRLVTGVWRLASTVRPLSARRPQRHTQDQQHTRPGWTATPAPVRVAHRSRAASMLAPADCYAPVALLSGVPWCALHAAGWDGASHNRCCMAGRRHGARDTKYRSRAAKSVCVDVHRATEARTMSVYGSFKNRGSCAVIERAKQPMPCSSSLARPLSRNNE